MNMLRLFLALATVSCFFLASTFAQSTLTVEACVRLESLDNLNPLPSGSFIYITAIFGNDKQTSMPDTAYSNSATVEFTALNILCVELDTSSITQTLYEPLFYRTVTLMINGDARHGALTVDMPDRQDFTDTSTVATAIHYQDEALNRVTGGTLTFAVYFQFRADYIKISQRNTHIGRQCFSLWGICLLEPGVNATHQVDCLTTISNPIADMFPLDTGSSFITDSAKLEDMDEGTTWTPNGTGSTDNCWLPYSQYVTLQTEGEAFSGIRLGTDSTFSVDEIEQIDNLYPQPYFSVSFSDDVNAEIEDWQYWVVNLNDTNRWPTNPDFSILPAYDISPLWLQRDSQPGVDNTHRMSQVDRGYIETWKSDYSVYYQDTGIQEYSTWFGTYASADAPFDADFSEELPQLKEVVCKQIFGYNIEGVVEPSDSLSSCWNTACSTGLDCYGIVFYPPILINYWAWNDYGCSNDISSLNSLFECTNEGMICDDSGDTCDGLYSNTRSFEPLYFECDTSMLEQITTIAPSPTPTIPPTKNPSTPPTRAPTNAPSKPPTRNPTEFPTGHPTLNPTTPSPTRNPTKNPVAAPTTGNPTSSPNVSGSPTPAPTESTDSPTPSPSRPTKVPTMVPSMNPTMYPVMVPSMSPIIFSSMTPTADARTGENNLVLRPWVIARNVAGFIVGCCLLVCLNQYRKERQRRNMAEE